MELCDECNNRTNFKFYAEKDVRDIQFFCEFTSLCVHIVTSQVI